MQFKYSNIFFKQFLLTLQTFISFINIIFKIYKLKVKYIQCKILKFKSCRNIFNIKTM